MIDSEGKRGDPVSYDNCEEGKRKLINVKFSDWANQGVPSVWSYPPEAHKFRIRVSTNPNSNITKQRVLNPCQESMPLMRALLIAFGKRDTMVFDWASGSGSFVIAATYEGVDSFGLDSDPSQKAGFLARLASTQKALDDNFHKNKTSVEYAKLVAIGEDELDKATTPYPEHLPKVNKRDSVTEDTGSDSDEPSDDWEEDNERVVWEATRKRKAREVSFFFKTFWIFLFRT